MYQLDSLFCKVIYGLILHIAFGLNICMIQQVKPLIGGSNLHLIQLPTVSISSHLSVLPTPLFPFPLFVLPFAGVSVSSGVGVSEGSGVSSGGASVFIWRSAAVLPFPQEGGRIANGSVFPGADPI